MTRLMSAFKKYEFSFRNHFYGLYSQSNWVLWRFITLYYQVYDHMIFLLSIITSGSYLDSWCSKPFVYNFHSIFDISNAMGTFEDLTISTFTEHSSGYHVLILKTWRANWWTQSSSTAARALRTNVNWSRNLTKISVKNVMFLVTNVWYWQKFVLGHGGQVFTMVLSRRKLRVQTSFQVFQANYPGEIPLWISKGMPKGYDIKTFIGYLYRTFQLDPPLFPSTLATMALRVLL